MGFQNVNFPSLRRISKTDAVITIRKSSMKKISFLFRGKVLKRLGVKAGDLVTPLVDMREQRVLFLFKNDRLNGGERRLLKRGLGLEVTFPRVDEFAELFQGGPGAQDMKIAELGLERVVFEAGLLFKK